MFSLFAGGVFVGLFLNPHTYTFLPSVENPDIYEGGTIMTCHGKGDLSGTLCHIIQLVTPIAVLALILH